MLPGKWDNSNWGRITSGAAAALKGRLLLAYASPLFNRNDDQVRWQAAYDANKAAYDLLTRMDLDWLMEKATVLKTGKKCSARFKVVRR